MSSEFVKSLLFYLKQKEISFSLETFLPAQPSISLETLPALVKTFNDFSDQINSEELASFVASFDGAHHLNLELNFADYFEVLKLLKERFSFDQLIDLCGIDYFSYKNEELGENGFNKRFGIVLHLLSINENKRLRIRCLCESDELPRLPSVVSLWQAANWFEREAFDLFGIFFDNHPDLRRILTDYGFAGHPFRKDFPMIGEVEMFYDEVLKKVAYRPVSIEFREVNPRVVREGSYANSK